MTQQIETVGRQRRPILKSIYYLSVFFLAFTGFGQMPIYKRYYISDIPGLGWSSNFYLTHFMHYIFAAIFLGLVFYVAAEYLFISRKTSKLNPSGYIRSILLGGIVITGIFLLIFNFSGMIYPQGFVIFLDLAHMGLVMALIVVGFVSILRKSRWASN
jgi:hypothetical protein